MIKGERKVLKKVVLTSLTILFFLGQSGTVYARSEQSSPQVIEVTYDEAQELMTIASIEAGNQGVEGMRHVMSVVLNRASDEGDIWPDNIHDVIFQPHQFATRHWEKAEITVEAHLALAEIEKGNVIPDIIAFETKNSDALDKYFDEAFEYKNHKFYVKKSTKCTNL